MMCLLSKEHVTPHTPVKKFSGLWAGERDFGSWDTKILGESSKSLSKDQDYVLKFKYDATKYFDLIFLKK